MHALHLSSIIIFHFASLEYPLLECAPLIVISTKLYRAGTWPVGAPPLADPHPHPTPPLAHPLCW